MSSQENLQTEIAEAQSISLSTLVRRADEALTDKDWLRATLLFTLISSRATLMMSHSLRQATIENTK